MVELRNKIDEKVSELYNDVAIRNEEKSKGFRRHLFLSNKDGKKAFRRHPILI